MQCLSVLHTYHMQPPLSSGEYMTQDPLIHLPTKITARIWEVDCLRGIAVALMIISNLLFDLYFFLQIPFLGQEEICGYLARFTAGTFVALAGVSLTLSNSRLNKREGSFKKYLMRGVRLLGWGFVVTAATWFVVGKQLVVFGVLHLIATSVILGSFFLRFRVANLFLGAAVIAAGPLVSSITVHHPWFLWAGLTYPEFHSVDYLPIFPWFGPFLIGMSIGSLVFPEGDRRFKIKDISGHLPVRTLIIMGRNSLLIYFIHQPVLLGVLYVMNRFL